MLRRGAGLVLGWVLLSANLISSIRFKTQLRRSSMTTGWALHLWHWPRWELPGTISAMGVSTEVSEDCLEKSSLTWTLWDE